MPNTALLIKNPLAATHEFKQACQLCYPKTGKCFPGSCLPLAPGETHVAEPRASKGQKCK